MSILETLNFSNSLAQAIDRLRRIVYNESMNTKPPVLTKDNTKMLAVEASTHQMARELAARLGVPLYVAVAQALRTEIAVQEARHANT